MRRRALSSARAGTDGRFKIALLVGLLVGAAAIAMTLSQAPLSIARVNTVEEATIATVRHRAQACQSAEVLPRGTSAIRLPMYAFLGPRVTLAVYSAGRVIADGERGQGWTSGAVTIPVHPLATQRSGVTLCFALWLNGYESVELEGESATGALAAQGPSGPLPGRIRVEYLRPGRSSWWSLAPMVARRMGLGHAAGGTWSVLLVAALMGGIVLACARVIVRGLGTSGADPTSSSARRTRRSLTGALRRIPSTAWLCAGVACVNAVCWSVITPPFESPDEPVHVAYVRYLAETGRLPTRTGSLSFEEAIALEGVHLQTVAKRPENQTISTQAQQETLEQDLQLGKSSPEKGGSYAGAAAAQPPLYYALQAIPYALGAGGTLLDRVELMRLLSAVMGGLTALFAFLFVREALPRVPWAWTVGGLGVALVPLLGFESGAVNPDSMLFAVTAALFYCLARAFRRGMTRGHALVLGALIAVGLLTKLNFIGIAPGALLGLALLSVREARRRGPTAYVSFALAAAIAISPVLAYALVHIASGARTLGIVSRGVATTHGSPLQELSYIWQLYLPRLPGMHDDFPGIFTARQIWFNWYVGLYGWLDTTFPAWVYEVALIPAVLFAGLCLRAVVASAGALRARAAELAVYCAMCVGLLVLIGADSYLTFPRIDAEYGQVRYLLPMLPLLAGALTLAARGGGRRWGPIVGAAVIMLFATHDVFSQLQVIARFYG
ncbi:MAG TPA: DUF2142 domain-containing protein [Solirubrobacteraceae bacterium]|nr:DUF2142 domain-containing protein [Solirubrobacteraceae bacterium]